MNPKTRADYEQLTDIAKRFGETTQDAEQMLRTIQTELNVLQDGDWVGQGATAFYREMHDDVLPSLNRLVAALASAQRTTLRINLLIQESEREAAALLHDSDTMIESGSSGGKLNSPVKDKADDFRPPPTPIIGPIIEGPGEILFPKPVMGDFNPPPPFGPIIEGPGNFPEPKPIAGDIMPPTPIGPIIEIPFPKLPGDFVEPKILESSSNPEDRRLKKLCSLYECTDEERIEIRDRIHDEKDGGPRGRGANLTEDEVIKIIKEVISERETEPENTPDGLDEEIDESPNA